MQVGYVYVKAVVRVRRRVFARKIIAGHAQDAELGVLFLELPGQVAPGHAGHDDVRDLEVDGIVDKAAQHLEHPDHGSKAHMRGAGTGLRELKLDLVGAMAGRARLLSSPR